MSVKLKATLLLLVWLAAYTVIGGIVLVTTSSLLLHTPLDDMVGILAAATLTIVIGWVGASWVQRRVDSVITEKAVAGEASQQQR